MAKQKGIIPLSGSLEGINFYMRKGVPVARKAGGGFNAAAIRKSPAMVRVRENNTEFGHCSQIKRVFKNALLPMLGKKPDGSLHGRLMRLFLDIKGWDLDSERGSRNVASGLAHPAGRKLLQEFAFTGLPAPVMQLSCDTDAGLLHIASLDVSTMAFPAGATHLALRFGILTADFGLPEARLFAGDTVLLEKGSATCSLSLAPALPVTGNGMRFGVLHYGFVQEVNEEVYRLEVFGVRVVS